jgi:hypothetical protein
MVYDAKLDNTSVIAITGSTYSLYKKHREQYSPAYSSHPNQLPPHHILALAPAYPESTQEDLF